MGAYAPHCQRFIGVLSRFTGRFSRILIAFGQPVSHDKTDVSEVDSVIIVQVSSEVVVAGLADCQAVPVRLWVFLKGFRPGLMARPVEIEAPIMVLFTMSFAGVLVVTLNGKSRPK